MKIEIFLGTSTQILHKSSSNKRNISNCLREYFKLEMKLVLPMTKSKQNIYGAWAIEIYSTIWVLSKYERGQIYDLPEENTSQLTIIMIMLLLLIILVTIK